MRKWPDAVWSSSVLPQLRLLRRMLGKNRERAVTSRNSSLLLVGLMIMTRELSKVSQYHFSFHSN